jgi:hypothetical protein
MSVAIADSTASSKQNRRLSLLPVRDDWYRIDVLANHARQNRKVWLRA